VQKKEEMKMLSQFGGGAVRRESQKLRARGRRLEYCLNCSSPSVILASDCYFMKCVVFYVVECMQRKWWDIGARGTVLWCE